MDVTTVMLGMRLSLFQTENVACAFCTVCLHVFQAVHIQRYLPFFNPKTSILIQKRPFYSGILNSELPGDSKKAIIHLGDV